MLRKKTGVLFTISSVNFELKQGPEPARPLSLSPPPPLPPLPLSND